MKIVCSRTSACILGIALLAGCSGEDPTRPLNGGFMETRGITLVDWTANGYGSVGAQAEAAQAVQAGATTLTIVVTAYQVSQSDNTVRIDPQLTPTAAAVGGLITSTGALTPIPDITVKLHVDLDSGEWRGNIRPSNIDAWFDSYRSFVTEWAAFSETFGVANLVVGTELAGTVGHASRWRKLISDVRGLYSGRVLYAASWDEAFLVPFWPALDAVGVNFFAPVAMRAQTDRVSLLAGWQPWLDRLRLLHKQAGLDVLLTEVGYRSVDGAGMHPYDFERIAPVDEAEQADLYWAALEAVGQSPWMEGVYVWNWLANRTGAGEATDYTPQDKPARKELENAWLP